MDATPSAAGGETLIERIIASARNEFLIFISTVFAIGGRSRGTEMIRCDSASRDDSDRPDIEPGDPHLDLLKSCFERLFEFNEELLRVRSAWRIDEDRIPH